MHVVKDARRQNEPQQGEAKVPADCLRTLFSINLWGFAASKGRPGSEASPRAWFFEADESCAAMKRLNSVKDVIKRENRLASKIQEVLCCCCPAEEKKNTKKLNRKKKQKKTRAGGVTN